MGTMRKKFKLLLIILASMVMCVNINCVSAHDQDYLSGFYSNTASPNQTNLKFRIAQSAQTNVLTSSLYEHAKDWNNKHCSSCTHIKVSEIILQPDYVPDMSGYCWVYGKDLRSRDIGGELIAYDANGNVTSATATWYDIEIVINNVSSYFSYNATAMQKTFVHEVGHALKLAHPSTQPSYMGHPYAGLPNAIMNQGMPDSTCVSSTITAHDISNLRAKWGGN